MRSDHVVQEMPGQKPLPPSVERSTRAVLFVDVVEYVRLTERDEEDIIGRWLGFAKHVETDLLPACQGRLVQRLGDGLLLEFRDVQAAVRAAFAIQRASQRENLGLPPDRQILLRIGIELTEVFIERQDVFGHGVNVASRLAGLAGPGEIVVSARVREQLPPVFDADIEDLGECFVRHVQHGVRAFRIGPVGPRPVIGANLLSAELLPTVAVIPFTPRDVPPDHHALGEVLAEDMIRELSHSPDLNVISRLSTNVFRGRDVSLTEINAHLIADYVVSGVYRVRGRNLTLDAELAETQTAWIVWSQRFDSRVEGSLAGGPSLIGRAVAAVRAAVAARELQRARSHALPTLKSCTLLMGAVASMHRLSLREFEQARQLLQALIDRASRQCIPQAFLAEWHVLRVQQGWSADPQQDAQAALRCTKQALDADPHCSFALAIDGFVHTNLLKRFDIAQERYDLAIQINPNDAMAWLLKGTMHAFEGDGKRAVEGTQRALRLAPRDPHRYFYESLAATAHLAAHQYDRALRLAQRSWRANRAHTSTLRVMAIAQWQLGLHEGARQTVQDLRRLEPALTVDRYLERTPAAPYWTGKEWSSALQQAGLPN